MDASNDGSGKKLSVRERMALFDKNQSSESKKTFQARQEVVLRPKQKIGPVNEESKSDHHLSSDCEDTLRSERNSKGWSDQLCWTKNTSSKYGDLRVFREPLCLIRNDVKGHLTTDQCVLKEIEIIDETVNVIAIAGPYRSGKSYLLNRLAGVKRGFPLGNTTDATTKGIWVWCLEHPERKHEVLMLLDTEGIGDVKKGDEENDNDILCLATLLSGTFVYNVFGVVDHSLLKKLSFVTKLSEKIVMSYALPKQELDLGFFFPSLVVCLRDFSLEISENTTSDDYFEKCLIKEDKGDKKKTMKYNEIRSSISDLFRRRKCFVFDRPVGDRKKLQKLEEVEESELTEDFRQDAEQFLKYMFSCKPRKLMDGSLLNGRMFGCLTEQYTESIAKGELPCIDDALTSMSIQENEIAVKKAVRMFEQQISDLGPPLPDDFELKYKHIQRESLKYFRQNAVLDDKNVFQRMAEREMDSFKGSAMEKNRKFLENICFQELQCMYEIIIQPKVSDGTYYVPGGYKQYRQDFVGLRENIKTRLPGVDSTILQMSGLEFEARYRQQDEEILEKASKSEFEIKAEIQKQQEKVQEEKDELLKKEALKKKLDAEEWKAYKDELSAEREREQEELKEKYEKVVADWQRGKEDLEGKIKRQAEVITKLQKDRSSKVVVAKKPAMKETVLKTMFSLIPVIGPIASGVYERYSSP